MPEQIDDDRLPFLLAALTIISFVIIIFGFVTIDDKDLISKILTAYIAWIGTIVGFYFGQKPVKDMRIQIQGLSGEAEKQRINYEDERLNFNDALNEFKKLEYDTKQFRNQVEQLFTEGEE